MSKTTQPIPNGTSSSIVGKQAEKFIETYLDFPIPTLLKFPKYFTLEPINRCNAECIMCGIDFNRKKKAVMSQSLLEKITNEMSQYKEHIEKIIIALDGEPLLDRSLHDKVRHLKDAGLRVVNVTTNASLLSQKRGSELIDAGLDEIYITIDSLKKPIYEAIRVGLNFEEVYNNTCAFIKLRDRLNPKLKIRVLMVQQELNFQETKEFEKHWQDLLASTDQIAIQKAHNWARTADVIEFGDEQDINKIPCISLWGTLGIHADGKVGICCMDTQCVYPLGDLNHNTLEEIWSSKAMDHARELHLNGQRAKIKLCDGCTVWRADKRKLSGNSGLEK
ncbi:MAG: SPASM domain-containing protein [Magnetococcales bacterium]|nr:SPASM domain-containing protein [Magnetococcales bacterium]